MRQLIAILLLSLQLFTGTQLCQLLKAPVLFAHYTEHKGGNEHLTFFSFLREHYFNNGERNPDYARDMQLPFKSDAGILLAGHGISIPVPSFAWVPPAPFSEVKKQYPCFQASSQPFPLVHSIFQPPRQA